MAHIVIASRLPSFPGQDPAAAIERIDLGNELSGWILGNSRSYDLVQEGDSLVLSLGHIQSESGSPIKDILSEILDSFEETQIKNLKERLFGQYTLVIKRGPRLFIFSDFMGVRNVFYSQNGPVISSSFERVEDLVHTTTADLNPYKILEFLAMRQVLYPAWLGRTTCHKRIMWLLPYEYLKLDTGTKTLTKGEVTYAIDNRKQNETAELAAELVFSLGQAIRSDEYPDAAVGATLTGGHDSRLVAAVAENMCSNLRFRIAASKLNTRSMKDLAVARKVAHKERIPLDTFWFQPDDEKTFVALTEGLSPHFNHTITPLIENAGAYSLGLGGVFGTELFMPIPSISIQEFLDNKIQQTKRVIHTEDGFWESFRKALHEDFAGIREHYDLSVENEADLIRIFYLIDTSRYASFLLAAFSLFGKQLDPYGSFDVFKLAFRIDPCLYGNHKRLGGSGLIQKEAMAQLNRRMGRTMTYMHSRPMLPLSATTLPKYLVGFMFQIGDWSKDKIKLARKHPGISHLPWCRYQAEGWEIPFFQRTASKYGIPSLQTGPPF